MVAKNQSNRLTDQQKDAKGVIGIFGEEAKLHDMTVGKISHIVIEYLEKEYPKLSFRYRTGIKKEEINEALRKVDPDWGKPFLFPIQASFLMAESSKLRMTMAVGG